MYGAHTEELKEARIPSERILTHREDVLGSPKGESYKYIDHFVSNNELANWEDSSPVNINLIVAVLKEAGVLINRLWLERGEGELSSLDFSYNLAVKGCQKVENKKQLKTLMKLIKFQDNNKDAIRL